MPRHSAENPTPPRALPRFGAGGRARRMLVPGEQVEAWASGRNASLLVATDRRVLVVRRSMWLYGVYTTSAFGYGQISSVEEANTAMGRYVQINAAGVPGTRSANTFPISGFGASDARETVAAIQRHLYAPTAGVPGQHSIPEQIGALARLRDSGAISPAEYEQKKNELLRRM